MGIKKRKMKTDMEYLQKHLFYFYIDIDETELKKMLKKMRKVKK